MYAVTERQVFVGIPADVKAERVGEHVFVAVGGDVGQIHGLALGDRHAAHRGVCGGGPHEFLDRCYPADHFLGGQRHQIEVVGQALSLVRVLDESL